MIDKRNSSRIKVNIAGKISHSNNKANIVHIESINRNGFLCSLKNKIPVAKGVAISILFPDRTKDSVFTSTHVSGMGVVLRKVNKLNENKLTHSFAVKFTELEEEDACVIDSFLTRTSHN